MFITFKLRLNLGMDYTFLPVPANVAGKGPSGESKWFLFPTYLTIRMAASIVKNERRFWKLFVDLSLAIVLSTLLSLLLNTRAPRSPYILHKSIEDTFVHVRYKGNLTFSEVNYWFEQPMSIL